jgi:N-acetylneuraminic acid mutarotase
MFGGDGTPKPTGLHTDLWRVNEQGWARMAGPFGKAQPGIYGTKGEAAEDNRPGARFWAASWTDEAGKLWLFGGSGLDSNDIRGTLNDLWMFDGTHWTWMAGNKTVSGQGQYGEAGVPSPSNYPGSRSQSTVWKTGNTVWLFGGSGYGSSNAHGRLNDLWRLDGSTWTFIGGSDQVSATGVYGTTGVNDPPSQPGSRVGAASWVDGDGRLWMFGGYGADEDELHTYLGDLWKFEL